MLKYMDIAGWDNYPSPKDDKSIVALKHDIMRGLKAGQSYMLTEQSPNQQNWQPYNKLKRPGEVRILSYQALAHGADGTFIATTMTGLVDSNDRCIFGEYPGKLKDVLGIWVEEIDALFPEETNDMVIQEPSLGLQNEYSCSLLCDIIHPITAKTLATYSSEFYKNRPCFTVNAYGKGKSYYIGTQPDDVFLKDFTSLLCEELDVRSMFKASANVEITNRVTKSASIVFVINHNTTEAQIDFGKEEFLNLLTGNTVTSVTKLIARDVMVLKKKLL